MFMTATLWTYFLICQNVVCNKTADDEKCKVFDYELKNILSKFV